MGLDKHDVNTNTNIKLYLKFKNVQNKKNKNVKVHESIFEDKNCFGLKGKKEALNKKNYETPLIICAEDGQRLIDQTKKSLQNIYNPIKVYNTKIEKFFNDEMTVYWFNRHQTNNKNKMKTNFLMYLDDDKRPMVEIEDCVYWFNSNLSYLS